MDITNPDECSGLQAQYLSLKKQVKEHQQRLKDLNRQLKSADAELLEYVAEIDYLQAEESAQRVRDDAKLSALQEAVSDRKLNHKCNVSHLKNRLSEKCALEEALKCELQALRDQERAIKKEYPEESELDQLSSEYDLLQENCDKLASEIQDFENKHYIVLEKLEQSRDKLTKLQQELTSKRNDLTEKVNKIESLTEEMFNVNLSLSTHENKYLQENVESSSLFDEVNKNRLYLQETLNNMKSNYFRLEEQRGKVEKMVSHLRKENSSLKPLWRKDIYEIEEDKESTIQTFIYRKKLLEEIIGGLNSEIEEQLAEIETSGIASGTAYKIYDPLIESKASLIKKIDSKLSDWYLTGNLHSVSLEKTNNTILSLQLQINTYKEQLDKNLEQKRITQDTFPRLPKPLESTKLNIPSCVDRSAHNAGFSQLPSSGKENTSEVAEAPDGAGKAETPMKEVVNCNKVKDTSLKPIKGVKFSADSSSPRPVGRKIYVMKKK